MCFKVFDLDRDDLLSRQELTRAVELLLRIKDENTLQKPPPAVTSTPLAPREDHPQEEQNKEEVSESLN